MNNEPKIALMSIRPKYAQLIVEGQKTFEFRRLCISSDVVAILIYATAPVRRLVGIASVGTIVEAAPSRLWRLIGSNGGISRRELLSYFHGRKKGFAISLRAVRRFPKPLSPGKYLKGFRPPQSFQYFELSKISRHLTDLRSE